MGGDSPGASHPGVDTLLLRRTFPELEASLITYFRRDVPREMYESYNEAKHVVTWLNGSTTRFGYCERERHLPVPGRGISIYRHRRADAFHAGAVAISDQPQSLPHRARSRTWPARNQSRQHRPRLGEGAVGGSAARSGNGPAGAIRSRTITRSFARRLRIIRSTRRRRISENAGRAAGAAAGVSGRRLERLRGAIFRSFSDGRHTARAEHLRSSRGGRDGSRLTGASSIPARCTGTPRARRRGGHLSRIRAQSSLAAHAGAGDCRAQLDRRPRRAHREIYLSPDAFARRTSDRRSPSSSATCWRTGCRGRLPRTTIASAAGC